MLSKMESVAHHDWCPNPVCLLQWHHVSPLCVSSFRLKHCVDVAPKIKWDPAKSYGGSWRRAGKIWMISNYKDTDISIWVTETFMVWVSGWLDSPVWVALERHWVELQTVSIPLDRGCKTGWEEAAAPCPLHRRDRDRCEGGQGGE